MKLSRLLKTTYALRYQIIVNQFQRISSQVSELKLIET